MLVWNTINVYKPEDKIEFSKWKELIQQELWKGKNDKMIYLYGNQLIAQEKMRHKSKIWVLKAIFLSTRIGEKK